VNDKNSKQRPGYLRYRRYCRGVLLAHKATKEGRHRRRGHYREESTSKDVIIPAVVFTESPKSPGAA